MAKMASLQQHLEKAAGAARPAPQIGGTATYAVQPQAEAKATTSRAGKTHIGAYLSPAFKSSLRQVQAQTGEDMQTLLARALNDLFRRYNVPVVDE